MQEAVVEGVQIMLAAAMKKSTGGHDGGLLMLERSQDNLPGPETGLEDPGSKGSSPSQFTSSV